ncbi:MAG: hypothetical protein IJX49_00210 [Clostridia bacterium]|nr:hypothetical protein [Clostridia bacterium]
MGYPQADTVREGEYLYYRQEKQTEFSIPSEKLTTVKIHNVFGGAELCFSNGESVSALQGENFTLTVDGKVTLTAVNG